MSAWISFEEKYPNEFPCKGRNYDLLIEDIITGVDHNNKAFNHSFFCKSVPIVGMSLPFTHWMPISEDPNDLC